MYFALCILLIVSSFVQAHELVETAPPWYEELLTNPRLLLQVEDLSPLQSLSQERFARLYAKARAFFLPTIYAESTTELSSLIMTQKTIGNHGFIGRLLLTHSETGSCLTDISEDTLRGGFLLRYQSVA